MMLNMKHVMSPITDPLREAIQNSEETIYRIAKESGVDYAVVSRFWKGERDLQLSTADRLAKYFGLELRVRLRRRSK